LNDWIKAFEAKDAVVLKALYSPDVQAYDISQPLEFVGLDAYSKGWAEIFPALVDPVETEFKHCRMEASGKLGYIACLQHTKASTVSGKKIDRWYRATIILRKGADGKWLDIHDHASFPTDRQTGASVMDLKP